MGFRAFLGRWRTKVALTIVGIAVFGLLTNVFYDELPLERIRAFYTASNVPHTPSITREGVVMQSYLNALLAHSSPTKWITLALADQGCIDMALNMYETGLKRFGITNYLIIASDNATCDFFETYKINCFMYMPDKDAKSASIYHSEAFLRKMNIRTYMILDALQMGFNVLHTDLDIYFMANPFMDFSFQNESYDLAALWDWRSYNAGFLFVRSTNVSMAIYNHSNFIADTEPKTDDQVALNRAIRFVQKNIGMPVNVVKLPTNKYLCGKAYWGETGRNFVEDQYCQDCVAIHNNWIISMESKRYRFKEIGMWSVDLGGYYSNPGRKYLKYDNSDTHPENETGELKIAMTIGTILKRTVILPKFNCPKKSCTLLAHLHIRDFDKHFADYRESSFLQHTLVPKSVKESFSPVYIMESNYLNKTLLGNEMKSFKLLKPANPKTCWTVSEILNLFNKEDYSILRFGSLQSMKCVLKDKKLDKDFLKRVKEGFRNEKYKPR